MRDPRQPLGPGCTIQVPMSWAPWSHMANGGMDWMASSWSNVTSSAMS